MSKVNLDWLLITIVTLGLWMVSPLATDFSNPLYWIIVVPLFLWLGVKVPK